MRPYASGMFKFICIRSLKKNGFGIFVPGSILLRVQHTVGHPCSSRTGAAQVFRSNLSQHNEMAPKTYSSDSARGVLPQTLTCPQFFDKGGAH